MSNYGLNFGFLQSDEHVRKTNGRFRIPAGVAWMFGTPVEPNPSTTPGPGPLTDSPVDREELRQAPTNAAPVTSYTGLLLQELQWLRSVYESEVGLMDSFMQGVAKPSNLAIITGGAGTKVWFRNTGIHNRADGRVIPARTMFDSAGIVRGAQMGWNAAVGKWVVLAGTAGAGADSAGVTNAWMRVTNYDSTTARVEAVLLG